MAVVVLVMKEKMRMRMMPPPRNFDICERTESSDAQAARTTRCPPPREPAPSVSGLKNGTVVDEKVGGGTRANIVEHVGGVVGAKR
jgi:hypothetical protein